VELGGLLEVALTGLNGVDVDTLALGERDPRLRALANDEDVGLAKMGANKQRKKEDEDMINQGTYAGAAYLNRIVSVSGKK
jgi:hypothetical protein